MQPKEKAIELIEKYCQLLFGNEQFVSLTNPKKCAIIAIDEILDCFLPYTGMHDQEFFDSEVIYYRQVKEEIENL